MVATGSGRIPPSAKLAFKVALILPNVEVGVCLGRQGERDLPDNAKRYIHALEDFIEARISSISTSPEREDTILVEDPFNN